METLWYTAPMRKAYYTIAYQYCINGLIAPNSTVISNIRLKRPLPFIVMNYTQYNIYILSEYDRVAAIESLRVNTLSAFVLLLLLS